MAPNPDLIRSDLLARLLLVESVAPVAPIPDALRSAPEFAQGREYQATVEARLPSGNFKVLIAGQPLQINLPESTRSGDTIKLMLIASEPRLKFVLLGVGQAGARASLSTTGRFLGALVLDAAKSPAALSLTSAAPVLSGPPVDNRQLPALLRQTLSQSGVFYESHQAQWVAGERTLLQLMQEPQGGLSAAASPRPGTVMAAPQPVLDSEPAAAAGAVRTSDAPVHEQALTLIQQQLAVLETGQLSWRGEIWPGQWMEWDIAERPPAASEADEPSRWQTRLRLTLPKLGEVTATLALNSSGMHIALGAAAAETAELFQGNQQPLAAAMTTAGLTVLAVEVSHDAGK